LKLFDITGVGVGISFRIVRTVTSVRDIQFFHARLCSIPIALNCAMGVDTSVGTIATALD
jgi:hypothetical protein